jgi:hypothetical protein
MLIKLLTFIKTWLDVKQSNLLLQQNSTKQQVYKEYIYKIAMDIQYELYCVMQSKYYSCLHKIEGVGSIRIKNYRVNNGIIVIYYELPSKEIPANVLLQKLKVDINNDIYSYQRCLIQSYGYEIANINHPYVYNGLYVLDIGVIDNEICIGVVSHYMPCM